MLSKINEKKAGRTEHQLTEPLSVIKNPSVSHKHLVVPLVKANNKGPSFPCVSYSASRRIV